MKSASSGFLHLIKEIFLIIAPVILLQEIGIILVFFYFLFQIYIKRKKEWLLKSLFYFFLFRFLNPTLLSPSSTLEILSWVVLLAVFLKVIFISDLVKYKGLGAFLLFVAVALLSSLFKSSLLILSLFKLSSFIVGFLTVFLAVKAAPNYPWEIFILSVWIFLLLFSLPTIAVPFIGFARNGTGFQGITNHPQFFGPFCAIVGGIATIFYATGRIKLKRGLFFLTLLTSNFLVIILSESRTAFILYLSLLFLGAIFMLRKEKRIIIKGLPLLYISGSLIALIVLHNWDIISHKTTNFLAKNREGSAKELSFQSFTKSRSGLAEASYQNFQDNPWWGNGFASPSGYFDLEIEYLPGTGIPISATMEKGVLFTLILEELGIIGLIAFSVFILSFFIPVYRRNRVYIVFILGPLILNLGEATFFSTNGQGIFLWMLLCLALVRSGYFKNLYKDEDLHLAT